MRAYKKIIIEYETSPDIILRKKPKKFKLLGTLEFSQKSGKNGGRRMEEGEDTHSRPKFSQLQGIIKSDLIGILTQFFATCSSDCNLSL